jgi:hypothetical protein
MIEVVEFHPACTVLARWLELGNNDFIIHEALEANYPTVLVEALVYIFPQQVEQQASFAITHCSASWSWCFRSSTRCWLSGSNRHSRATRHSIKWSWMQSRINHSKMQMQ